MIKKYMLAYVVGTNNRYNSYVPLLHSVYREPDINNGYFYDDLNQQKHFSSNEYTFIIYKNDDSYKKCKELTDKLNANKGTYSHILYQAYIPSVNTYSQRFVVRLVSITKENDDTCYYEYQNKEYQIKKEYVSPIIDKSYDSAIKNCRELISRLCDDSKCHKCKYSMFDCVLLKCSSCIHANIKDDTLSCCRMKQQVYLKMSDSHFNTICNNYYPMEPINWRGFKLYTDSIKNCYCNTKCGFNKRKSLNVSDYRTILQNVKLYPKNTLFYDGKIVEYVVVNYDKWINGSFISNDKLYVEIIKFKKVRGWNPVDPIFIKTDCIDLKPDAKKSANRRLEFIHYIMAYKKSINYRIR